MLSDIEQYVVDCIQLNRKPSGRKLAGVDLDHKFLYCKAHNITPPTCSMCDSEATFISIKKGFGKYCSKQCYQAAMSARNKLNNRTRNKEQGARLMQTRYELYGDIISICEQEYKETDITIKQLAEKYNIEKYFLARHFRENKLSSRNKTHKVRRNNLLYRHGFNAINTQLDDYNWVKERIDNGWTCKNFANELQCCSNYVSRYLKQQFPNIVFKNTSSYEVLLLNFLDEIGISYKKHTRGVIPPKELDVYVPDRKIAIEVNGVYWHSAEKVDKNYHLVKTNECIEQGIRLLHFTDSEIFNKEDCVKSIIKSSLNLTKSIPARKCSVIVLSTTDYRQFCEQNHIQGYAAASVKLGLVYEGELVAAMSFSKPRFNKKHSYELIRYCNLLDHTVVGGANKLFKYFISNYQCDSIISYCQRRLFTGNMYKQLGMIHVNDTPPNYVWVNSRNDILTRYQTQRHKLDCSDSTMSESDIMKSKGFYQIFDSGQSVFVWYK